MKLSRTLAAVALAAVAAGAAPADAHHSVYGAFDKDKSTTLKGVVQKVDWINPHTFITLYEGDGAKGKIWHLECQPPAFMRRAGVTKDMIMGGSKPVEVVVLPARKQGVDNVGFLIKMTMADGKVIQFAPDK